MRPLHCLPGLRQIRDGDRGRCFLSSRLLKSRIAEGGIGDVAYQLPNYHSFKRCLYNSGESGCSRGLKFK